MSMNRRGDRSRTAALARAGLRLGLAAGFAALSFSAIAQTKLEPLADGFPNRPITLVVNDDPGSAEGIMATHLQAALAKVSPVPILISDEPAANGGTFDKLKELHDRDGGVDGYYPMAVNVYGSATDPLTQDLKGTLGMTIEDMNVVSVLEVATMMVVTRADAPYGNTWQSFVDYVKAHPGEAKYISVAVGGGNDIAFEYISRLAGIRDDLNKVPDVNVQAAVTTIAGGEGDVTVSNSGTALGPWQDKRLNIVMSTLDYVPAPWDKDTNVVTAEQAGLGKIDLGNYRGWAVLKDTPKEHVDWLYKLMQAASQDPEYIANREKVIPGTKVMAMSPEDSNKLAKDLMAKFEPIVRAIGLAWDQQN